MSIEEKAKAYDEALERANKQRADYQKELDKTDKNSQLAGLLRAGISAIDMAFPELRESENERMIRKIKSFLSAYDAYYFRNDEWREIEVWLENQKENHIPWYDYQKSKEAGYTIVPNEEYEQLIKQKEQKPAEKQDYSGLTDLERAIHWGFLSAGVENVPVTIIKDTAQDCLAQIKPVWSEEDETAFGDLMWCIEQARKSAKDENNMGNVWFAENWVKNRLKSLSPSWKPSEEQMKAFRGYIEDFQGRANAAVGGWNNFDVMIRLYEQLKKL